MTPWIPTAAKQQRRRREDDQHQHGEAALGQRPEMTCSMVWAA
jgi:hypothetical protein